MASRPNLRVQRTRSSPSARHSPLTGRLETGRLASAVVLALVLVSAPCSRAVDLPPLSQRDRDVVTALLQEEARHLEKPRPILVLDSTDVAIPPSVDRPRPADTPPEVWSQMWASPASMELLRQANAQAYTLIGVDLPAGAALYRREDFEREYESERLFKRLVRRLGGLEPLVLSVSRPALDDSTGEVLVILNVFATWSGCGGVDLYSVSRRDNTWFVDLRNVLGTW